MNELDGKLIGLLSSNSRMSIEDLATATGCHRNTVSKRLSELEKNGIIIKYTIELSHKKIHAYNRLMFIVIRGATMQKRKALLDIIKKTDIVKECHKITGRYDFVCKIMHDSAEDFSSFEDNISNIPGLITETFDIIDSY